MTPSDRDRLIIQHVARFKQLDAKQIFALVFEGSKSKTSCDRALKRLAERGALARIKWPNRGGEKGGASPYVYQLGPKGHAIYKTGRYRPARAINHHSLTIADAYIQLVEMERNGLVTLHGKSTEPECWVTIGEHELTPDLLVDLTRRQTGNRHKMWLEIDMGSEGQRQIKDKLSRYWGAYLDGTDTTWPDFMFERDSAGNLVYEEELVNGRRERTAVIQYPIIVFVAVDQYRAQELKWLIEQGPKDAMHLFRVMTLEGFSTAF